MYDFILKNANGSINILMFDRIEKDPVLILLVIALNFKRNLKIIKTFIPGCTDDKIIEKNVIDNRLVCLVDFHKQHVSKFNQIAVIY